MRNTCLICGEPAPPKALYCGPDCRNKGWHRQEICRKSGFLVCDNGYCDRCGWNPEIEELRRKEIAVKYGLKESKGSV